MGNKPRKSMSQERRAALSETMKNSIAVTNQHLSPEWRAKISATMKGVPKSPETRARMSEARTGRRVPNFFRGTPTEYNYLHRAVEVVRGKPQVCYICQATDPRFIYEWANLTGDYGNVEDYRRLCKSCHSKFDQGRSIK